MNKEDRIILEKTIESILDTYRDDHCGVVENLRDENYTLQRTITGLLICLAEKGIISERDIGDMC